MKEKDNSLRLFNTVISLSCFLLATHLFSANSLTNKLFEIINNNLHRYYSLGYSNSNSLKLDFLLFTGIIVFFYTWYGKKEYSGKIFILNMLLILPEVIANSQFKWLLSFNIDIYETSRSFLEVQLLTLLIITGYIMAIFNIQTQKLQESLSKRGFSDNEVNMIKNNQLSLSFAINLISFILVMGISFGSSLLITNSQSLLLSNFDYIILGVTGSTIITSSIYIFLHEKSKTMR